MPDDTKKEPKGKIEDVEKQKEKEKEDNILLKSYY